MFSKYRTMFVVAAVCVFTALCAIAGDVPGISPEDFADSTSGLAPAFWGWLAGEGFWGAIVVGVLGFAFKLARPVISEYLSRKKLERLFLAVETGVIGLYDTLTKEYKAQSADGKLTKAEAEAIKQACREYIIRFSATQGIDAIQTYGGGILDMLIEWMLSKVKSESVGAITGLKQKITALPLPDLH